MGHLIVASSVASVHFCPCHVTSSPEVNVCSSQCCAVVLPAWFELRDDVSFLQAPACTDGCLSLHFYASHPRLCCNSPVGVLHESVVWWCARSSAGSWACRFWPLHLFRCHAVGPSSASSSSFMIHRAFGAFICLVRSSVFRFHVTFALQCVSGGLLFARCILPHLSQTRIFDPLFLAK